MFFAKHREKERVRKRERERESRDWSLPSRFKSYPESTGNPIRPRSLSPPYSSRIQFGMHNSRAGRMSRARYIPSGKRKYRQVFGTRERNSPTHVECVRRGNPFVFLMRAGFSQRPPRPPSPFPLREQKTRGTDRSPPRGEEDRWTRGHVREE